MQISEELISVYSHNQNLQQPPAVAQEHSLSEFDSLAREFNQEEKK